LDGRQHPARVEGQRSDWAPQNRAWTRPKAPAAGGHLPSNLQRRRPTDLLRGAFPRQTNARRWRAGAIRQGTIEHVSEEIGPQLDPNADRTSAPRAPNTAYLQALPSIGETGFEPATARPPAREFRVALSGSRPCAWGLLLLSCFEFRSNWTPNWTPNACSVLAGEACAPRHRRPCEPDPFVWSQPEPISGQTTPARTGGSGQPQTEPATQP
jgi:hypothetical protein